MASAMKLLASNPSVTKCLHRTRVIRAPQPLLAPTSLSPSGPLLRPLPCTAHSAVPEATTAVPTREEVITSDPANNVTDNIFKKIGVNLHQQPGHPLCIIKNAIYEYFDKEFPGIFAKVDDLYPIVSTKANFDDLLIPADHVSRSPNDTYYINPGTVLRCHTSAHQTELLRSSKPNFLITGDVYRRDTIDATHYPVFHQMEAVRVFSEKDWMAAGMSAEELAEKELKACLEGLARHLFGNVECRWVDAYFPFTTPSFELEIFFKDEWLEVLGCGVMQQSIVDENYKPDHKGWAFGLGLERWAMVLFDIPDIRLFWTNDPRMTKQFASGDLSTRFKPFSKYPPCFKDIAFWLSPAFSENNFCELVRSIAGDLVEEVKLLDEFEHPKTKRTSNCFRITYRSTERSLTDEEVNDIQGRVREQAAARLDVELR